MPIIRKIAWENRDIEAINDIDVNSIYFWLNEKHIQREQGIQMYQLLQTNMTKSMKNVDLNQQAKQNIDNFEGLYFMIQQKNQ